MKEYKPTNSQRLAKARMYKWLAEHTSTSIEDMTIEAMNTACKARNLSEWMAKEGFSDWWYEKGTASVRVAAGAEIAIERLIEIVSTPQELLSKDGVSIKDVLTAADKLCQLADLYPKKKVVEKFLDKRLNSLDAEETAAETKALEAKLKIAAKND